MTQFLSGTPPWKSTWISDPLKRHPSFVHHIYETYVDMVCVEDASKISYHEIRKEDCWRVDLIKELVDTMWGENIVEGFSRDELSYMLGYTCVS